MSAKLIGNIIRSGEISILSDLSEKSGFLISEDKVADHIDKLFKKYDVNGDETLDLDEFTIFLRDMVEKMGCDQPMKCDIEEIFCLLDTDGDFSVDKSEIT